MSSENGGGKKDDVDASERVLALALEQHAAGAKLLKSKEELLTPKGKAEAIVVDSLESAGRFVSTLLQSKGPEGSTAGEQAAHAQFAKTQAQLAQWVIETALGITPTQGGRVARGVIERIQAQSLGATLAARLAAKQGRPRIVEAATPARNDSDSDAADGGSND
jgi:hypothetical protein